MKITRQKQRRIAIVLVLISAFLYGSLWGSLGERGMWVDKTGAAGYTTAGEFVSFFIAVLFDIIAVVLVINSSRDKYN